MRLTVGAAVLCAAAIAVAALTVPSAEAATKKKTVTTKQSQVVANRARTRVRVQRRSFLDGGTEVLPGERKFMDYAFPPGHSPTSVIDNTAFSRRSPLPGPYDLPGRNNPYPWGW
jgi:hypothetical protein